MGEVAAELYTQDGTIDIKGNPALKSNTGNWRACPYILANECCERLAYYGMSTNLVNFMKDRMGMANAAAANNVTNWGGTCYITPLIGAFLADAYLGRFWTIASFMIIYIFGLGLLTMATSVHGLVPACASKGVCDPTPGQSAAVFIALYLIALGTGGIKPCVSSFGADQFDEHDDVERKSKSSFFNWFYFSINIGALVASSVLVYVQTHVGWSWGFGIPAVVMAIAVGSFFVGTPLYRHQRPGGSPLTRIAQVLVAATRKLGVPVDGSALYETADRESGIEGSRKLEHTGQFRFLDKAAVETQADKTAATGPSPWRLCTVTQVEELKSVVRLLPIWASGIVFATVYGQMSTMFVLQGNTLDASMGPKFKIPSASLSIFDTLSVIAWVPVYDRILVPAVRSVTGRPRGFTQLQRMGIGLVVSMFAMLTAGVLELVRLRTIAQRGLYGEKDVVPISIFWQVPQYFIIGAAEVFTFVGQLEFFYDQAPDAMRSMCSALSLTTVALGNYLSTLLVTVVAKLTTRGGKQGWIPDNLNVGHLDYFFWLLAALSLLNFAVYLLIASWYTYKKTAGDDTDAKAKGGSDDAHDQ
ncbi:protein NRT1/ PTR FAMILY 8.1 [Aegilops tauschii subsp. strangulata]|uniref:Peptide transporter PTR5 n=1 Tax=Aegilops tauschii subsp. strangulata TaxID=200361 RepID=A0A453DW88_AEGTS|nr:protein NRT1/ PTR FAMILY 8.1 [Aegilops tauschii subsp. strangulata]XP_020200801.1 protein NRT1/ PTR FAMILY 8.1 [Aegilops tauschii subsp. strangulata]XP_020200802.1 protein NRT1/ PTR FAMILY 8.1 [Aegilops tauschii subsp. strangulata]XP_020200803.1 protein NRT1/ PTR FAMILY 8.1 [Aegilops tauschii subsp. strangulata]